MTETAVVAAPGETAAVLLDDPVASCIEMLRQLLRIETVNPPGNEMRAVAWLARQLRAESVEPVVVEPELGRGSLVARLSGDGTGGGPLLLMGHLDVVPVEERHWSAPPFGAEVRDGDIVARGAVDMKAMVAMETQVFREVARAVGEGRLRLRRDLILAATADEEAGGIFGMRWIVDHAPELVAADAALNEAGGISVTFGDDRVYPVGVGEKGHWVVRITVSGAGGHGSVPRTDATSRLLARLLGRLGDDAALGPRRLAAYGARLTRGSAKDRDRLRELVRGSERPAEGIVAAVSALARDTFTPTVVEAGRKDNVIPHEATVIVDCRTLVGVDEPALLDLLARRLGPELRAACRIEILDGSPGFAQPGDHPLLALAEDTLRRHDPEGLLVRVHTPFSTDAKHTRRIDLATYGFSPLRMPPGRFFLDEFHAVDERVPVAGVAFGLAILRDVVRAYCA